MFLFAIFAIAAAAVGACGDSSDAGGLSPGGEDTGPVRLCSVDPATYPLVSGKFVGRMAFSDTNPITFPIEIELDIAKGRIAGALAFSDSKNSYKGEIGGHLNSGASLNGHFDAFSGGTKIEGAFYGNLDGRGGCGTWTNFAGQGGPWIIGEPGLESEKPVPSPQPIITYTPGSTGCTGCRSYEPSPISGTVCGSDIRIGNDGDATLEFSIELDLDSDFLYLEPPPGSFTVEPGELDAEFRMTCTGPGEGLILIHSNDLTPTVSIEIGHWPTDY